MKPALEPMKYPLYLFDVDFDALPKKPVKPSEAELQARAAPTFTEEELKRECDKAWEEGRQEGLAQSNAGFEHQIAETLSKIDDKFSALDAAQRKTNERIAQSAVRLAAAIAAKVAPEYARENGLAEIEAFVAQCLSNLFGDVEVAIRVPAVLAEDLTERLPPLAKRRGLENGVRIIADPDMAPTDCRIDWTDGGAERNGANLLASIDDIVEKFLDHSREQDIATADVPEPATTTEPNADATPLAPVSAEENAPPPATPKVSVISDAPAPAQARPAEPAHPAEIDKAEPEQTASPPPTEVAPAATPKKPDVAASEAPLAEKTVDMPAQQPAKPADINGPPALPGAVGTEPSAAGAPALPGAIAPARK